MKTTQPLTDEQERMRLEGLRVLARIIARHALARTAAKGSAAAPDHPSDSAETGRKDGAA